MTDPVCFHDRLLAEAVRHYEAQHDRPLDEADAVAAAQAAGGGLEQRIVARARALSVAPELDAALAHLRQAMALSLSVLVLAAVIAGTGTVRLALWPHPTQPVNVYWLLASVLGLPLLTLLGWLGLMLVHPETLATRSLAGLARALGRRLGGRWYRDPVQLAALRARAGLLASAGGRWRLSAVIHGLWVTYLSSALVTALILLSVRQYSFAWETTILSAASYQTLTQVLSALPKLLGFAAPHAAQIAASQWHGSGPVDVAASAAWSGLVLGCIAVYGILPRFTLMLVSLWLARRAQFRFQLKLDLPGYACLRERLAPSRVRLGVVDADQGDGSSEPRPIMAAAAESAANLGPPAIVGLEIEPADDWPPPLGGAWLDLGHADDRDSRRQVLQRLAVATPPRWLVVACSLAVTPDRGSQHFLEQLRQRAGERLVLLLSEGQRLRQRAASTELAQRVSDWRGLGQAAGIAERRIIELDLEHLTEHSRSQLRARLGLAEAPDPGSHLKQACDLIAAHVARWRLPPDAAAQGELHRAIARLYRGRGPMPRLPLPDLAALRADLPGQLQRSADRMRDLLPARLRLNPRWLSAGALGGALGCIALATVTAPAALTTLPIWSAAGAALALFTGPARRSPTAAGAPVQNDFGQAVAAAALFALLLELQSRSEAAISRALDDLLDDRPPIIGDAATARSWLSVVQQRYAALRAREAA